MYTANRARSKLQALLEQEVNYEQAITTGKLLTYLILLLTGEIGDRKKGEIKDNS